MIKIIVLGSGLIPRGHGIAPCAVPFEADLDLVKLIMKTNGMVPYAVSLRDGHKVRLTCSNIDRIYRMSDFSGEYVATAKNVEPEKPILAPSIPEPKFTTYVEETKPEVKPESEKKNDGFKKTGRGLWRLYNQRAQSLWCDSSNIYQRNIYVRKLS